MVALAGGAFEGATADSHHVGMRVVDIGAEVLGGNVSCALDGDSDAFYLPCRYLRVRGPLRLQRGHRGRRLDWDAPVRREGLYMLGECLRAVDGRVVARMRGLPSGWEGWRMEWQ